MAKKIRLDFSKVEERSGWNTKQIAEGLHEMKIESVQVTEATDGTDMLVYALRPTAAKHKTRLFPYYCKLQPNQLFKIRDLIVATGGTVPKKSTLIDPDQPVGKLVAAEVNDESNPQYAGRSTVDGIYATNILDDEDGPASDEDDEDEVDEDEEYEGDEEEADDEDDEEEEDEEDEDLEALSLVELRKRAKGLGVDTAGLKKAELIEAILEEEGEEDEDEDDDDDLDDEDLDDEEFEDEEEEEEEPAKPARRAAPAKKTPAKAAAPARRVVKRR